MVHGSYTDEIYFNTINSPLVRAEPHALVHARLAAEFGVGKGRAEVALFVRNLFDAAPLTYAFDLSLFFGNVLQVHAPPRTIGLSAAVQF